MRLQVNQVLRASACTGDRHASRAITDQRAAQASRYRDYPWRFVTTRKLSPFRLARRKPARSDSPVLGRWRLSRPKPHPRLSDLRAHNAQAQVRSGDSSHRVRVALRVTRFPCPHVGLRLKPASDGLKRNLAATLLPYARPYRL